LRAWALIVAVTAACSSWQAPPVRPAPSEGLLAPRPVAFFPSDELTSHATADGRYVVFVSDQTGNLDVWVRDYRTASTYPRTTDSADDFDPAVSADGRRLVFVSRREDAKGDIFVGDIDSGDVERLTDAATADRQPRFSPDGDRVYFTTAAPGGPEYVAELDLRGDPTPRRLTPGGGFDSAPSPDGRFVLYTAATEGRPQLMALRLSDRATRAIPLGEGSAGFARFIDRTLEGPDVEATDHAVVVRFADDDDGDGQIDGRDAASLWRVDLDLDAIFDGAPPPRPFPLTAGSNHELFADPAGPWLYFTQTARLDQNVVRLPLRGQFPDYERPADYINLAQSIPDPRTRWFALRCAVARSPLGSRVQAEARLRIANIHVERGRLDLASPAFEALIEDTRDAMSGRRWAYGGIARVELLALERTERLRAVTTPDEREAVLVRITEALADLADVYATSPRVAARIELESAEVAVDRGRRVEALDAFDRLVEQRADVTYSAARAMLRRVELLGVAYDPDAVGEAYAKIFERYPTERRWVNEAAERIVEAHVEAAAGQVAVRDALRRIVTRTSASPVRVAARRRLAALSTDEHAAAELRALADEAESFGDRPTAADALEQLAQLDERRGALDEAVSGYRRLRDRFGDLVGVGARASAAITSVSLIRAAKAEARRDLGAAWDAYREVIANDSSQVHAYRRYLALSTEIGLLGQAISEAAARVAASPRTPIARYVYGLALTWLEPPALDDALEQIDEALELNPQFAHGYLTRGWIREMLELSEPESDHLERAIEDYKIAARLNLESQDPITEAAIIGNLGNARWRLGLKSNDLGNVLDAAADYRDRLAMSVPFDAPQTELVFWERFGRASAWADRYDDSVMATERAIEVATRHRMPQRLHQLWGNLAIAHVGAGDDDAAATAFDRFAESLPATGRSGCVSVAARGSAFANLRAAATTGRREVWGALKLLASARKILASEAPCGGPDRGVTPTVDEPTRAPLGFEPAEERAITLALAADAHRLRGQRRRARAVDRRRAAVAEAHLEGREDNASRWYLSKVFEPRLELLTAEMLRELVAVRVASTTEDCAAEGDVNEACIDALNATIDWVAARADLDVYGDKAMAQEWGRALVLVTEALVAHAADRGADPSRLRPTLLAELRAAAETVDAAAVRARLEHARGLLRLASASAQAGDLGSGKGTDLAELIGWLDDRAAASEGFAAAATSPDPRVAESGRLGALLALEGTATPTTGGGAELLLDRLRYGAALGAPEDALEALDAAPAFVWPPRAPELTEALERAAAAAVAAGRGDYALELLDRRLLVDVAAGRVVTGHLGVEAADRRWAKAVAAAHAGWIADPSTAALDALLEATAEASSDGLRARVLAESVGGAAIRGALVRGERLVVPFRRGDALGLLFVEPGDDAPIQVVTLPRSLEDARREVLRAREIIDANQPLPPDLQSSLRKAWVEPILDVAPDVEVVILADAGVGGPIPLAALTDAFATAHVSAPSSLPIGRAATPLGAVGAVAIAGPGGALASAAKVDLAALVAHRRGGKTSKVSARTRTERLDRATVSLVVVDRPVELDADAPGRSAVMGWDDSTPAEDRFSQEVLLDELGVAASVLALTDVRGPWSTARRLDLSLAIHGIGAVLVVPATVPRPVVRRVMARFATRLSEDGPAKALALAVRRELEASPAAGAIRLIGAPGYDAARTGMLAARALKSTRKRAAKLVKRGRHASAAVVLRRWIRLMNAAKQRRRMALAYNVLVNSLLKARDLVGAVDAQRELIGFLEGSKADPARRAAASAELGYLYSKADDSDAAVAAFEVARKAYDAIDDAAGAAKTLTKLAHHHRDRVEFEAAASAYERSVERYEAAGAFTKGSKGAMTALSNLGSIALNRLSDPMRAKAVYERLRAVASSDGERVDAIIALARVARRRGDFAEASRLVVAAEAQATQSGLQGRALDAVIESANVAWKRGDYAAGNELCARGLTLAQAAVSSVRGQGGTRAAALPHVQREIYVRSVCGLVSMSQRDFDAALQHLDAATVLAETFELPEEVAAQKNNQGRVLVELGRLDDAVKAFEQARAIDESLSDRRGLAYDDRNLGAALAKLEAPTAEATLRRALASSKAVRDENNEMHALFELGELAGSAGRWAEAAELHRAALVIAERYDVKALEWQLHRALGRGLLAGGEVARAEAAFERAVAVAAAITGPARRTDFGVYRFAAMDDLMLLRLDHGDPRGAFAVAQVAGRLGAAAALEDGRVGRSGTSTGGVDVAQLAGALPEDSAIVQYRVTDEALVVFVVDHEGLVAERVDVDLRTLRDQVRRLGRGLEASAEVSADLERLWGWLIQPVASRLASRPRLAFVPDDVLRYVPFAALGPAAGPALIDTHVLVQALEPSAAARSLAAPFGPIDTHLSERTQRPVAARPIEAFAPLPLDAAPLALAAAEVRVIGEAYPEATLHLGRAGSRAVLLDALKRPRTVVHFAGHTGLSPTDGLAGRLETADGPLELHEILATDVAADLVVLSGCETRIARRRSTGDELRSLAEAFQLAGADAVVSTPLRVEDVAAAMVMKRLYRGARRLPLAEALRAAQQVVRRYHPHPAWWATFTVMEAAPQSSTTGR